ncbi:MAG: IS6 family transposase [Desulfobacter sp.]|nr:MAG: IS6 family transposase [Desulfobacter sp.]
MKNENPFKWRHYEKEIILLNVRWYLRYQLSYRNLEEMMQERGLSVDHSTIYRWVQRYAPEMEKRSRKYLRQSNDSYRIRPRVLSVDGNPAYPPAVKALKEKKLLNKDCILRQNKYLNNIIEQDHRFIKKLVRAGMGFKTFHSAWRTLKGYEIMNMIRKGQVKNIRKGEILKQKEFVENLFSYAA